MAIDQQKVLPAVVVEIKEAATPASKTGVVSQSGTLRRIVKLPLATIVVESFAFVGKVAAKQVESAIPVRRVKPSITVVSFGVRNKIKPFSSLLIYTEQETTTPVPTQVDSLGSYVDLEVLNHYVWMEFEKYPEYRRNTVYYFVGEGMDEMLLLAPPDFPLVKTNSSVTLSLLFSAAKDWLQM